MLLCLFGCSLTPFVPWSDYLLRVLFVDINIIIIVGVVGLIILALYIAPCINVVVVLFVFVVVVVLVSGCLLACVVVALVVVV